MVSAKRGQVMVLGCVTMLALALSTLLSFSVAHAVHERIRLQSYADASAYSMAVVEARAMNYIAYSNRAIAAAFVSMTTAHAYVAAANSAAAGPLTGLMAMGVAIAGETALGCYFPNFSHCPCIIRIVIPKILKYALEIPKVMLDSMSPIEKPLNKAVEGFVAMIQSIHKSQRDAAESAGRFLSQDVLKKNGAPCASAQTNAFGKLNKKQFACALEGSPLDDECDEVTASSKDDRKKIMANVVNASRPSFTAGGPKIHMAQPKLNPVYHEDYVKKFMKDIPSPRVPGIMTLSVSAFMADGASAGSCLVAPGKGTKGDAICANASHIMVFPFVIDTPGIGTGIPAVIGSGDNQSYHGLLPFQHSGSSHNKFKKMFKDDACGDNTLCFINYRMGSKANNWGQPLVFFVARQDLNSSAKANSCNTAALPWHLNQQGQVNVSHGARGQGKLNMRPQQDAFAASQAMVYFHRTNTWQAPPNLFEPYWRAKLHPFKDEHFRILKDSISN